MNQISKQAIEELEKTFQVEKELLVESSSKVGVFERIATRIIPMLRSGPLTKDLVGEWDQQNKDGSLLERAYRELDAACQQIQAGKGIDPSLRKHVNQVLEEVRKGGSCWNMTDKDCEGVFIDTSGQKSTMKIEKAQPPCHRVYYKLRALYVSTISKTHEITFAPSAWRVIQESSHGKLALKVDANPRYLWRQLSIFEECWAIRNDELCIAWPEASGEGLEMWLNADNGYRRARLCRLAGDFSFIHHYGPDRGTEFFQRESLEQLVGRLFKEIILILRRGKKGLEIASTIDQKKHQSSLKRLDPRLDDRAIGIEKMRGYWEKHPKSKLGEVAKWLHGQVRSGNVTMKSLRAESTYKSWARDAGLQPDSAKIRGKDIAPRTLIRNRM